MSGASVRFALHDGEELSVADEDLGRVYDLLWGLVPKPGAVSTAAVVRHASGRSEFSRNTIELTAPQSAVLREAVALLRAEP